MLLVIHAGLHKTASTYLQNVLRLNRAGLRTSGIYYELDTKLLANHGTAWMALIDDFRHVAAHVKQAVAAGCRAMILSSEDFEGLIFAPGRARALEAAATSAGVTEIEWHFCLRDPGEYLASMYAELSKHLFVDHLSMFLCALRDGRFRIDREARRYPAYWEFCFDHRTHLTAFAAGIAGTVAVHDFADADPFPGHGLLTRLGVLGRVEHLPGPAARNTRPSPEEVAAHLAKRLDEIVAASGLPAQAVAAMKTNLLVPLETQAACADAVSRRFRPGMEALLQQKTLHSSAHPPGPR